MSYIEKVDLDHAIHSDVSEDEQPVRLGGGRKLTTVTLTSKQFEMLYLHHPGRGSKQSLQERKYGNPTAL
jgi:hypothetical protein